MERKHIIPLLVVLVCVVVVLFYLRRGRVDAPGSIGPTNSPVLPGAPGPLP